MVRDIRFTAGERARWYAALPLPASSALRAPNMTRLRSRPFGDTGFTPIALARLARDNTTRLFLPRPSRYRFHVAPRGYPPATCPLPPLILFFTYAGRAHTFELSPQLPSARAAACPQEEFTRKLCLSREEMSAIDFSVSICVDTGTAQNYAAGVISNYFKGKKRWIST